ncbi:hypothetical protein SETIT_6G094200v2 [Setaria italica]|nr:hypothetical protein SETIT_6G094200v2 [Setaria italica]
MEPSSVPFYLCHGGVIRSYAVHPGGNRFYVSVTPGKHYSSNTGYYGDDIPGLTKAKEKAAETKAGTYTYRVKSRYYDPELDAWVGFDMDCHGNLCKIGSCDIPSRSWGSPEPPTWKLCEKNLSLATTSAGQNTDVLVGMGSGKFCLVQSKPRNGVHDCSGDGDKFELHTGELTITDRRLISSYVLSRYAEYENFSMQAFWI